MSQTILVVEDELKLATSLCEYLNHQQYETHMIHVGDTVVEWVKQNQPSLVLLDLMLPGKDGVTICKEIRSFSDIPIIMLTARSDEIDKLLGLEIGADDYICKPYSLREVMARVKAVLRRFSPQVEPQQVLHLNKANFNITYNAQSIELTAIEFRLLETMMNSPGRIYSREQLANNAYEDNRIVSDRTVDSHIKKLRKKLNDVVPDVQFIHSIYGVGYKYDV